ncbi:MAG: hypothetical protein DCF16_12955 [Alphaproteobacteria bacterium]|nr:MAG: hypothetical protein DCF16_12955 [Alphaproteobacteria bacterium]
MTTGEHTINGLVRKRSELMGRIEHHAAHWQQAVKDMDAIDAAIRIMAPEVELDGIAPKPVPPVHAAYKGEVARLVADCFRLNPSEPLSTVFITDYVMRQRGLDSADRNLRNLLLKRVSACLGTWRRKGRVTGERPPGAPRTGEGSFCEWRLTRPTGEGQATSGYPTL